MRNRSDIFNGLDIESLGPQGPQDGIAAGADTFEVNVDFKRTGAGNFLNDRFGNFGGGKGSGFLGTGKAERTGGHPGDNITLLIGDADEGIVVRGLNIHFPLLNLLPLSSLAYLLGLLFLNFLGLFGYLLFCFFDDLLLSHIT